MKENYSFLIEEFLSENYRLFAIMGVFGALSIYLTTLPGSEDLSFKMGIVASFILFIIVSFLICLKALEKLIGRSRDVSLRIIFENTVLVLFTITFGFLVLIIAEYTVNSFLTPLKFLFMILSFIFGLTLSGGFLRFIEMKLGNVVSFLVALLLFVVAYKISSFYIFDVGVLTLEEAILVFFILSVLIVSVSFLLPKIIDLKFLLRRKKAER